MDVCIEIWDLFFVVAGQLRFDGEEDYVVRVKARVNAVQVVECAQQEARAGKDNHGQSDLHDNESFAKTEALSGSVYGGCRASFERSCHVGARSAKCRRESKTDSCEQCHADREEEYGRIGRQVKP